ncbi:MAG: hypothetical protein V1903_06285 [Bacteroidota bacterium]
MKNHFITLFNRTNRTRTIFFLSIAVFFFPFALFLRTLEYPAVIWIHQILLFGGAFSLFTGLFRIWALPKHFFLFAGACFVIALIPFFVIVPVVNAINTGPGTKFEEALTGVIFFIIVYLCIPGIIFGLAGAVYRSAKK